VQEVAEEGGHLEGEGLAALEEGEASYLEEACLEALWVAYLALEDLEAYLAWEGVDAFHLEEVLFPMVEVGRPFPLEVGVV
jgi:hypothetical protein